MKTLELEVKLKITIDKHSDENEEYCVPENWEEEAINNLFIDIDNAHPFYDASLDIEDIKVLKKEE